MFTVRLEEQVQMLANRLRKRCKHLQKWSKRTEVSCYRLYDRDIPEIPLAIDWYEGRVHVAEYARRHSFSEEEHATQMDRFLRVLTEVLEIPEDAIYLKLRERQHGNHQYMPFARDEQRFVVSEGGHRFWVNLSDYLDTGLFLDHRLTRALIEKEADGKAFLNLFAYTGAFTVYAAAGGATRTVTVDLSNTYLRWAQENLELNALWEPKRHRLVHSDVFAFLKEPERARERYDLVVIDPPTFSNSKRMTGVLDIQRDHVWLLRQVIALTTQGGAIYFSTNFRSFQFQVDALHRVDIEEITTQTTPEDFRAHPLHRCWRLVVL